jgi:transposase
MKHIDMRCLPPAAQEERRRQVIGLRESGMTHEAIARQVGLTRNGVSNICKRYRERGKAGLQTGPRGPAVGTGRFLTAAQEKDIRRLIRRGTPDKYDLPHALWSRAAVAALIEQRSDVRLAVRTMGTYLARWGFTPQKPLRRAYEQKPCEVRRWQEKEFPAIKAKARRQKGTIFWGDESGLRSDDVRGRSYAPCGKTPVVRPCQKRASVGVISAVTNKGELRWMILNSALTAVVLISFLERLIRDAGCKVFLILDRLPVHRTHAVRDWLAARRSQIEKWRPWCMLNPFRVAGSASGVLTALA